MTDRYRAQCKWQAGDFINAYLVGGDVFLAAHEAHAQTATTALVPAEARAFARGILALADRIDGGEAADDGFPVGTRVRVLEAYSIAEAAGMVGTVYAVSDQPGRLRVRLDEPWGDAPSTRELFADRWERVDAPASVKVGDRVRVVRNAYDYEGNQHVGEVGTLRRIDEDDQPYKVELAHSDWWCAEVERVDETPTFTAGDVGPLFLCESAPVNVDPARLAVLEEARHFAGPDADDDAVLQYARFLAGE
jgi:hypothetical protein